MSSTQPAARTGWDWGGPARLAIGLVSAFLLLSMGGAQAIAAPATVPAMWWATRSAKTIVARLLLTLVAVLTMLVVGWMIPYNIAGENPVAIAIGIGVAVVGTIVVFGQTAWTSPPSNVRPVD